MTPMELVAYLGFGLIYALVPALIILGGMALVVRQPTRKECVTLYLAAFFLMLTQHPFPNPSALDCSGGGVQPILDPLNFADRFARYWQEGAPPRRWLQDKVVQSTIFNFVLLAAVGFSLGCHLMVRRPYLIVLGAASALSASAEIMQLTGLFGLFPCPYRTFETTDLITNIGGMLVGFHIARKIYPLRRTI